MQLPARAVGGAVCLDPFGDGIEHRWVAVLRPFGVEPDDAVGAQIGAAFGEGVDIFVDRFGAVDDELKFIGAGDVVGERQFPALGAQGDPVERATNRERTAGFKVGRLADGMECIGQCAEVVNGWFAASDDGKLGLCLSDFGGEGCGFEPIDVLGDVVRVPSASGVAPWAMHRTTEGADEVGGPTCMRPFALEGVELFVDREFHGRRIKMVLLSLRRGCRWWLQLWHLSNN